MRGADDQLHVMSFNLRYASDSEPNSWRARRPAMAELFRLEQPTVIGTQEGLYGQLRDIAADLPGHYDWIGVGRAGGSRDEFMAIFFDTRRLAPLEFDHFWLSDTPALIGSRSWGNVNLRMVTWVRFADAGTGRELVVVNTHFDQASENARVRSAELVRDRINAFPPGLPVVLTGDFNAPAEGSAGYDILVKGAGLTDTWTAAAQRTPRYGTFHGYAPPVPDGARIDWILTRGAGSVPAAGINTFARDGQLPSDHSRCRPSSRWADAAGRSRAQSGNGAFHIGDLLSMDISDAELDALFAKWRQDIDTAPFRHTRQLATTVRQWACRQRYLAMVSEVIDRLHGPFRWSRHNGRYGNINNR